MEFNYLAMKALPQLSWCAVLTKKNKSIEVFHGPWVETTKTFFVEGAWDGDFSKGEFDTSYLMGSGGKLVNDKVVFCTPYHSHERLHMYAKGEKLYISPSLVFILQVSKQQLDYNYLGYHRDLLQMVTRLSKHIGTIPLMGKEELTLYHFRNIEIDMDLNINVKDKIDSPDFSGFEEYKQFLTTTLKSIFNNANSPQRKIRYLPISTVSSGYDSNACSTISYGAGNKEAVTFTTARPAKVRKGNDADSGKAIGEKVGLKVTEYDRFTYRKKEGFPEAEFMANGDFGQDFELCAFEEAWKQRVVIVGDQGDRIWDCRAVNVTKDLIRWEPGGNCVTEYKYRVGFIYVHLPFIGALSHPSLHRISNSPEMEPWRMHNRYDRPIPRRIIEEKGVDRQVFGQNKKAISFLLNSKKRMSMSMKPESRADFEEFYKKNKKKRHLYVRILFAIMWRVYRFNYLLFKYPNILLSRLRMPFKLPMFVPKLFEQNPGRPSFLVFWGMFHTGKRYSLE